MGAFKTLLRKDLRCTLGNARLLVASLGFALLLVVVGSFAFRKLGYGQDELRAMTPGILLTIFLFAGITGMRQSFQIEYANNAIQGILFTPVDPLIVFLSKCTANFLFAAVTFLVVLLSHAVFFGAELGPFFPQLCWHVMLFALGYVVLGTLFSAVSLLSSAAELLLPLLLFPLLIPLLAGTAENMHTTLGGGRVSLTDFWFMLVAGFDLLVLVLGGILFEYVVQD